MAKSLEERVVSLEKRVAALEGQVRAQPKKFISEDSNGICDDLTPSKCPKSKDDLKHLFNGERTYP
ncbi:hypothetical protein [Clostridium sp. AWRP]|uniref:hypothetical protein n=1 Tax=Clostridium sp. AWRP TaxID=2212991 RepID=UPI000FD6BF5B|nr:hypothetical protein [Clostridium sp. AWRP]AZV56045.1 hypothetical protein DMR38_05215 [Clostridium sp. AWRP]